MLKWLAIPDYEGLYEINERGCVRSVERVVAWGKHGSTTYRKRELRQTKTKNGYLTVKLSKKGVSKTAYVHVLVLLSFMGPRPVTDEHSEIRHLDSDKTNNYLSNLIYGTSRENSADYQKIKKLGR